VRSDIPSVNGQTSVESPSERLRVRFVRPDLPPLESVHALFRESYEQGILTNGPLAARFGTRRRNA